MNWKQAFRSLWLGAFVALPSGFSVVSGQMTTHGDAISQADDCFRLTPDQENRIGAIWSVDLLNMNEPFDINAEIYLGNSGGGGDGMAFVLRPPGSPELQPDNGLPGTDGMYLGYGDITPSLIVEVDTDRNGDANDPNNNVMGDHLAIMSNGDPDHDSPNALAGPVPALPTDVNIEDDEFHNLRVTWDPATQELSVYFDCEWRLTQTVDAIGILGTDLVHYGFTACTRHEENEHRVCDIAFSTDAVVDLQDQTVCDGESVTITIPSQLTDATWSPIFGLDVTTGPEVTITPVVATYYTVEWTGVCGDVESESFQLNVDQEPAILPNLETNLCNNEPVEVDPTPFLPAGFSATWGVNEDSFPVTIDAEGTYDWNLVSALGCVFDQTLDIGNTTLNAIDLGSDVSLCPGESVTFDVSADNPGLVALWNGAIPGNTLTASQAGTYTVEVGTPECSVTDEVEVFAIPTYNSGLPGTATLCVGETVTLNAQDPTWAGAPPTFTWADGTAGSSLDVSNAGPVTVSIEAEGCTYSETTNVVNTLNVGVDLGADQVLCEGEVANFNSTYPAASSSWTFNGSSLPGGAGVAVTDPGTLELEVDYDGCITSGSVTIDVIPAFDAALPASATFCAGDSVWVEAASGADSYVWSTGGTSEGFWASTPGNVTLETTESNCAFTAVLTLVSIPLPNVDLGGDVTACAGSQVVLTTGVPAFDWIEWNGVAGSDSFEPQFPGIVEVEVSVNGCVGGDEVTIDFVPVPTFELGADTLLCPGDVLTLNAGALPTGTNTVWTNNFVGPQQVVTASGMYGATATIGNCTHSDSIEVTFADGLSSDLPNEWTICLDEEVEVDPGFGNYLLEIDYFWSNGDSTAVTTMDHEGSLELWATTICETFHLPMQFTVENCDCLAFVPSAFTPDNDGHNDRLIPMLTCDPAEYLFEVFDRWGRVVFRSTDVRKGWIGEVQDNLGGEQPDANAYFGETNIYGWVLTYAYDRDGALLRVQERGTATLIR
jgi:hypothetical protein